MHFHFCTKELMAITALYEATRNCWYCWPYWKAKIIGGIAQLGER